MVMNTIDLLTETFRKWCGFTPIQAAQVFIEERGDCGVYRMWVGNGHYDVAYEIAQRIAETKDPHQLRGYVTGVHPALAAWPILARLVDMNEPVREALFRLWPDLKEESRKNGFFQMSEDMRIVAGITAMEELRKRLRPQESA